MGKVERQTCPECGASMIRTFGGPRCPRLSACGRGGIEETQEA